MDRLGFFKQGLSSVLDAASSIIGLKKAADSFVEVVDEALSNIKTDIGFHLPSIDSAIYDGGASVLDNLAAMGYSTIEVGTYNNGKLHYKSPDEIKELARKANIKITAAHLNHPMEEVAPANEGATEEVANSAEKGGEISAKESAAESVEISTKESENSPADDRETAENKPFEMSQADSEWWSNALSISKSLGCKYVTTSHFPENPDEATIDCYAAYFDAIGQMAAEQGMKFCFHPSTAELRREGDAESAFEKLAQKVDINKVWFQIDTLEATEAATNVCDLLERYEKRILLLHLHDYGITGDSGVIDFDEIVKQGVKRGVADIFIEVRDFSLPAMNCVERSYFYVDNLPSVKY